MSSSGRFRIIFSSLTAVAIATIGIFTGIHIANGASFGDHQLLGTGYNSPVGNDDPVNSPSGNGNPVNSPSGNPVNSPSGNGNPVNSPSGNGNPVNSPSGNGNPVNSPSGNGVDQQGNGNVAGTVNNYPSATPDPPSAGSAYIDEVVSADGGPTMSTTVIIRYTVQRLPTNGNHLVMVCNLLSNDSPQRTTYYGKGEVTNLGAQEMTLQFGGQLSLDPIVIGTTRNCGIVSANATAFAAIFFLQQMDEQHISSSPIDGHQFDRDRVRLPDGSAVVSNQVAVTVERF
jgi:hypothetical protein